MYVYVPKFMDVYHQYARAQGKSEEGSDALEQVLWAVLWVLEVESGSWAIYLAHLSVFLNEWTKEQKSNLLTQLRFCPEWYNSVGQISCYCYVITLLISEKESGLSFLG